MKFTKDSSGVYFSEAGNFKIEKKAEAWEIFQRGVCWDDKSFCDRWHKIQHFGSLKICVEYVNAIFARDVPSLFSSPEF